MHETTRIIGLYGHAGAAIAYLVVAAFSLAVWRWRLPSLLLVAASLATAAWASAGALDYGINVGQGQWRIIFSVLRQGLWIALLWALLHPPYNLAEFDQKLLGLVLRTGALMALWFGLSSLELQIVVVDYRMRHLAQLLFLTTGLVLTENLYRRASAEARWNLKFLCIGLAGAFAYDLFFNADSLLSRGSDPAIEAARGVVQMLSAILIGISVWRLGRLENRITVSRTSALYTGTLTAAGAYLCLMALMSLVVRRLGGDAATSFQAMFLFSGLVLLAVLLVSGQIRGHFRNFINRHFFHYKYDYRTEWLRFTETLSHHNPSTSLETRVVKAMAQVLDSPAGAMWIFRDGQFNLVAAWNLTTSSLSAGESEALAGVFESEQSAIDIGAASDNFAQPEGPSLPLSMARIERAWVVVPMLHHETLVGAVLLTHARAPRDLDWEDIDLLKVLGRHAASYISEQEAGRALAEVREFEKLNRRFAFALHDLKNLVSRLSLLSSNIERHGDKPEFRQEMLATIVNTTTQMKALMGRLQKTETAVGQREVVALRPMLEEIVALNGNMAILNCDAGSTDLAVSAEPSRLAAVFNHLLENATQAIGAEGWVRLHLLHREGAAMVELVDNGIGMDPEFIERELFRPFRSTKRDGFGLGAYQCREYVREIGGEIEVVSSPGAGTTVRVILPLSGTVTSDVGSVVARAPAPAV